VLLALMAIFTLGNVGLPRWRELCWLMAARVLTSLAHGTFFGVGSVVATGLVAQNKRRFGISTMFTWPHRRHAARRAVQGPGLLAARMARGILTVAVIGVIAFAILAGLCAGQCRSRRQTDIAPRRGGGARSAAAPVGSCDNVSGSAGCLRSSIYSADPDPHQRIFRKAPFRRSCWCSAPGLPLERQWAAGLPIRGLTRALIGTLAGLAIVLVVLAPALEKIRRWLLMGCWCRGFRHGSATSAAGARKSRSAGQNLASSLNIRGFQSWQCARRMGWESLSMPGSGLQHCHWSPRRSLSVGLGVALWSRAPRSQGPVSAGRVTGNQQGKPNMQISQSGASGLKVPA